MVFSILLDGPTRLGCTEYGQIVTAPSECRFRYHYYCYWKILLAEVARYHFYIFAEDVFSLSFDNHHLIRIVTFRLGQWPIR